MTELLPEFSTLPVEGVFDGELVAFGDDGLPSFDRVSRRILHGQTTILVALVFFDVLELRVCRRCTSPTRKGGRSLTCSTSGRAATSAPGSTAAPALWDSVCERGLEGVVAKRLSEPYRPGERSWLRRKNSRWSRYRAEREAAIRKHSRRR
jgi:bifunctional non-homologous end joining protein LigD